MTSLGKHRSLRHFLVASLGLGFVATAWAQKNDLGVEAVVAPHFSKDMDTVGRSAFGLDFFRVSSGASLLALYGTGGGYDTLSLSMRLSGFKQFFGESYSRGFVYGIGFGAAYSPGAPKELTNTNRDASFVDLHLNPYLRYLFDINGWLGPYVEVGYDMTLYRIPLYPESQPLKAKQEAQAGRFVVGLGFAFEVER